MQRFLHSVVGREVSEEESSTHWKGILARQGQLVEKLGRPVTVMTAAVDYFQGLGFLQNLVLLDHEELKQLRHDASTDPLTGLYNRRMFEEHLDQEIDRSTRYGSSFALLFADLRNFKSVNDMYGHATGDSVLRSVARASIETLRRSDIPCRIGGDEFAILLPQAERPGSEVMVKRITQRFEKYARPLAPSAPVGIDCGVAIFPEDGQDAASLAAAADRSLYTSKQMAHCQSAYRRDLAKLAMRGIKGSTHKIKVHEAPSVDFGPPYSVAPVVTASRGEKRQVSENAPDFRRFERVRPDGTSAQGIVHVGGQSCPVRVLDASPGGVGFLVDQADLPDTFHALLQVSVLPEGELTLNRVYTLPLPEGKQRVGCVLTSSVSGVGRAVTHRLKA